MRNTTTIEFCCVHQHVDTIEFCSSHRFIAMIFCLLIFVGATQAVLHAQESDGKAVVGRLAEEQDRLKKQFVQVEELFLRMSEFESSTNPARASLLQQAAKLCKEYSMSKKLGSASDFLAKRQFTRAIEEQQAARESLKQLLVLLQSENRADRIRSERERIEKAIKDIRRLSRIEQSLRARTENGQDMENAAKDQQRVKQQASDVADALKTEDEETNGASETESSEAREDNPSNSDERAADGNADTTDETDSEGNESENTDAKGEESENSDKDQSNQTDAENSQSDSNQNSGNSENSKASGQNADDSEMEDKTDDESKEDSENMKPKEASTEGDNAENDQSQESQNAAQSQQGEEQQESNEQPSQGQQSQSQQSQNQQNQQQPQSMEQRARERVEDAMREMEKAREELEDGNRDLAVERQRKAEEELNEAIEELERILRQLREEEVERSLADLESRFKRMLQIQNGVLDETKRLNELTGNLRDRQIDVQSNKQAIEERKILVEGQKAMLLLREEGSSHAFPEALEQMLSDAETVADLLSKSQVNDLTVAIEEEIVTALEEMLGALEQLQKNNEERKQQEQQQQQQQQSGGQGMEPLVDALAELRLIRTLQLRVNSRTDRLANQVETANEAMAEQIEQQLDSLSQRQEKIKKVTREIALEAAAAG